MKRAVDMSCIQVDIKILLYSFLAWIARTWLDCKNKGPSGLFKSTYINVLSALKWQASLNLSLNSQIKVDTVKNTQVLKLFCRAEWGPTPSNLNMLRVLLLG